MPVTDKIKMLIDQSGLQVYWLPVMSGLARLQGRGVQRIFLDDGIWMHQTARGYFAYHQPWVRLDLARLDEVARKNFFWGYHPRAGDVVMDVGAGVGEETLTFSRAVGEYGKVICIEAHPRTHHCLEKMVQFNRLKNVIAVHMAATQPGCSMVRIEDCEEYLTNRSDAALGISVPATTIDMIHRQLNLGRVHFLKMNIEGGERFAIHGMTETLKQTEILCVSCHDFLAQIGDDESLRTKSTVREFLQRSGLRVVERSEPGLPPYVRDQVWAYNEELMLRARAKQL